MSLRFRLILLVLMAVIPALGITWYSGIELRRLARESAVDDAFRSIRMIANSQASLVDSTRHQLNILAVSPEIRGAVSCDLYLQKIYNDQQLKGWVVVADPTGQVLCSTGDDTPQFGLAERAFFQRVLENKQPDIGRLVEDAQLGLPLLPVAAPVIDDGQNVLQVVVAMLNLSLVVNPEVSTGLPPNSALLLVDAQGTVLARYPEGETWAGKNLPDVPIIGDILKGRSEGSSEARGVDGVQRLYAFTPLRLSDDYVAYMAVGIPSETVFAGANRLLWQSLTWIGLAGLLAFLAAWFGGDVFFLRVVSLTAERDAAEGKLREANQVLESRVSERTSELANVNILLQGELAERRRTEVILRQREVELHRLLTKLERSNRDLQDFAYITSHDLQEPLRKIQAFGERLSQRYADQLGEEGQMFTERMTTSANRMQKMINDLLAYSRVSTQQRAFVPVALNGVLKDVLADLELRIEETGARVEVGPLPEIQADPLQMQQVFLNLLTNALKFHRPDVPPVIRVSAEMPPGENGNVRLCVEDNGIGFDEKYLDRIFLPFQRLHSRDAYEGSGIGLAVVRKIIERHDGEITATSTAGQGSRFIVTLPLIQKKDDELV